MKIDQLHNDDLILQELGSRLEQIRLRQNLTQAALAERAGISTRTLQRLESGAVATALTTLIRVCRELGTFDPLEVLFPTSAMSPMDQLKKQDSDRKRASGARQQGAGDTESWTWGDDT